MCLCFYVNTVLFRHRTRGHTHKSLSSLFNVQYVNCCKCSRHYYDENMLTYTYFLQRIRLKHVSLLSGYKAANNSRLNRGEQWVWFCTGAEQKSFSNKYCSLMQFSKLQFELHFLMRQILKRVRVKPVEKVSKEKS